MINAFCPKCNALTSMTLTTKENNEKDREGKLFKAITTSYNCNMCHSYIRSEKKRYLLTFRKTL